MYTDRLCNECIHNITERILILERFNFESMQFFHELNKNLTMLRV